MSKLEKRIILIFELILFILVVVSLNDRIAELVPFKATPILCILMSAGAVVGLLKNKRNKDWSYVTIFFELVHTEKHIISFAATDWQHQVVAAEVDFSVKKREQILEDIRGDLLFFNGGMNYV